MGIQRALTRSHEVPETVVPQDARRIRGLEHALGPAFRFRSGNVPGGDPVSLTGTNLGYPFLVPSELEVLLQNDIKIKSIFNRTILLIITNNRSIIEL
ncbi:MAG: hypothetical protein N2442_02315 [Spirochaetes bacterium]|nr:hypothetical protein [Spirochaetota bacterium]